MPARLKRNRFIERRKKHMAAVIERNIDTLLEVRRQLERKKSLQLKMADAITAFCGSMTFVYLHVVWFALWIVINMGWSAVVAFDPFPFGLLTMIVSLEAIFLSTFVLISQNRMSALSDERSDLDLQVNLLAEYEVTKVLKLVDAIADKMGLKEGGDPELEDLEMNVPPEELLREMARKKNGGGLVKEWRTMKR